MVYLALCKASFVDVELKSEDHICYYYLDDFTEASLTEHEHQVVSLKNYYEENKEIFKLTEKREALWAKKIDFEVSILSVRMN